jgi:hypothetical protein
MRATSTWALLVIALCAVLLTVILPESSGRTATAMGTCPKGTVKAVIAGKRVCLKVGQKCEKSLDARYHRYRFHCHSGRLEPGPRFVTIEVTGPPEVLFDWTTDRCDDIDIPDTPARAFRDAEGNVQVIATHHVNRRLIGPGFSRLRHPCEVIMQSGYNPDPAAYDDHEWIHSVWTPDGRTVYAIVHNEHQAWLRPDQCSTSEGWGKCWFNALTLAVSRDGGRTYVDHPPPKLVASVPYPYVPDGGPLLMFGGTNIVRNPRDGYFYTLARRVLPGDGVTCLLRTKTLADPSSWRAWSGGTSFRTSFVDPYGPNPDPDAHLCKGLPTIDGEDVQSVTYSTVARQWLLTVQGGDGAYYQLSPDLVSWTPARLFLPLPNPWDNPCAEARGITQYPSLIDPASTSRNFETSGKTAYLFYTYNHPFCELGDLDRDLVRVRVAIRP